MRLEEVEYEPVPLREVPAAAAIEKKRLRAPRRHVKRRERQAKDAERRLEQRAWLVGTSGEVARELRENAAVAKRCEEGYHVSAEAKFVSLLEWESHNRRGEMGQIEAENPKLWRDLETAYAALKETRARAAKPPPSADLLSLADRVEKAARGD
jgi:hypothetical protein